MGKYKRYKHVIVSEIVEQHRIDGLDVFFILILGKILLYFVPQRKKKKTKKSLNKSYGKTFYDLLSLPFLLGPISHWPIGRTVIWKIFNRWAHSVELMFSGRTAYRSNKILEIRSKALEPWPFINIIFTFAAFQTPSHFSSLFLYQ